MLAQDFEFRDAARPPRASGFVKQFDALFMPKNYRGGVFVQRASDEDIDIFRDEALQRTGRLASAADVKRVARIHPDNIWAVRDARAHAPIGCYAQIMLTEAGLAALLDGRFDGLSPKAEHCATPDDPIAAIYTWVVVGPARAALGVTLMARELGRAPYRQLDIYTIPITEAGRRSIQSIGYRPLRRDALGEIFVYRRLPVSPKPQRIDTCLCAL